MSEYKDVWRGFSVRGEQFKELEALVNDTLNSDHVDSKGTELAQFLRGYIERTHDELMFVDSPWKAEDIKIALGGSLGLDNQEELIDAVMGNYDMWDCFREGITVVGMDVLREYALDEMKNRTER